MDNIRQLIFSASRTSVLLFGAMVGSLICGGIFSPANAVPGGFQAKVVREANGTAKVIFQPIGGADHVSVRNRQNEPIGVLNWAASFEVSVTEDALRESTTQSGIDLNSLLRGVGTVAAGDQMLVAAELPTAIRSVDGREMPAGTQVYFALDRLAKEGVVAPVVAWGGKNMGPGGAVNNFNDRLLESGVKGARTAKAKAANTSHSHTGVHGDGYFSLDTVDEMTMLGQQFLTSPTCTMSESQKLLTKSPFGHRKSFTTTNGQRASSWHDGVDISGKTGTPIVAAAGGCISVKNMRFNRTSGYGLTVVLDHPNGFTTQYSHMQNFTPEIRNFARTARSGDRLCLERGTEIGQVGQTGNCTGPHLHFGVKHNGKAVNPKTHMLAKTDYELSRTCDQLSASNEKIKRGETEMLAALSDGWQRDSMTQRSTRVSQ